MTSWLFVTTAMTTLAMAGTVAPEQKSWLAIARTDRNLGSLVSEYKRLKSSGMGPLLVASDDCKNLRPGFFLLTIEQAADRNTAESAALRLRGSVAKDAYASSCEERPDSIYALRLPLLDASILTMPELPVSVSLEDVRSSVRRLSPSWIALIRGKHLELPNDPREGFRTAVSVRSEQSGQTIDLDADCWQPQIAAHEQQIAIACVRETAADHPLHQLRIIALPEKRVVAERDRCRNPRWASSEWVCDVERVDASGRLSLSQTAL